MNELASSTTKNISAWNINAQHGKWTYPDPADPWEDIWSRCDADYSWYGWEGENNSLGAISVVLYATGKGTLFPLEFCFTNINAKPVLLMIPFPMWNRK